MTEDKQKQQAPIKDVKLEDLPVSEADQQDIKGGPTTGTSIWIKS